MKKIFIFFIIGLIPSNTDAQITSGKVKWVSASNIKYNYTGELLNGKPHGRGFAVSEKGEIEVFGEFKNGKIDGSTVIRHINGRIVVARWRENKPEGTGVLITPENLFQYGNFVNGQLEGKVIRIQDDNRIVIDFQLKNGASNGRAIVISKDGNFLTDKFYINDTSNGQGYQYEVDSKQKYEGIWKNGEWVRAATGNYPSFMRNKNFGSTATSENIWIYSDIIEKDNKKVYHDTCFAYDLKKYYRWFGYFDRGKFTNGIRLLGDSTRTIGQFVEGNKKHSFCIEYKLDKYLMMGNFKNNELDGLGIYVDIDDSTIYDGFFTENSFTGRAVQLIKNKEIRIGDFEKGILVGNGKTIFPDGRSVSGKYENGKLSFTGIKEVIKPDGKKIDINPKNINAAINFLLKEWENNFSNINSGELSETESGYYSWYEVPNGFSLIKPDRPGIDGKPHHEFSSEISEHGYYDLIKSLYDRWCKELTACTITSLTKGKVLKLIPKINKLNEKGDFERIASFFTIPAYTGKKHDPQIRVMVENKGDAYKLTVDIISKWK